MMRFISFGSGTSGNCCCLFTEHDGLMIDSGVGCRMLKKRFCQYGLSMSSVKRILITHDHCDHIQRVGSLSHDLNIPVFATKKVHEGVEKNRGVVRKIDGANIKYLEKDKTEVIGDFEVTPFDVPHKCSDNVGFFISHEGVNFCLITDAGYVTETMKSFIRKANYLVIEADYDVEKLTKGNYPYFRKMEIMSSVGHLSNLDCAMALAENATSELKRVWLCHISSNNNSPEIACETVTSVLNQHGIVVGENFLMEPLKRCEPTGIYDLI
ncbi:MAG: MBL fold metallo-hydrolase [Prevotella sp.]|nr:MBL fold metallo-hydrolase [Prevotella sp.]